MKILIFFSFLFASLISAQDMMRIKMKNGILQTFPLESISKITFSGVTSVDEQTQEKISTVVKTFSLFQNYPNPFNPSTTIKYYIPGPNIVSVRIFDVSGRIISTPVNEYQQEGDHQILWNGDNTSGHRVSSGMYVYEVRHGNSVLVRKMIMVK